MGHNISSSNRCRCAICVRTDETVNTLKLLEANGYTSAALHIKELMNTLDHAEMDLSHSRSVINGGWTQSNMVLATERVGALTELLNKKASPALLAQINERLRVNFINNPNIDKIYAPSGLDLLRYLLRSTHSDVSLVLDGIRSENAGDLAIDDIRTRFNRFIDEMVTLSYEEVAVKTVLTRLNDAAQDLHAFIGEDVNSTPPQSLRLRP